MLVVAVLQWMATAFYLRARDWLSVLDWQTQPWPGSRHE